ncbi:SDR family NAD(P)-dependent oxidoreductase [Okeania sp. SIO2C9]|uniref:SDR family NAD(P)-dependent oxidoreductase n=1 Tax=Okeania sp. SIO2C9 TaxID=2607791 RepID=UPI0025F55963|nr:SDR family NAD(P)-dependent oxidoreductase [Okeania sp. SIO2C9]
MANFLRHFIPQMLPKSQGVIVNFSAAWGRYTTANAVPYCASKWAIEGLTKALAQELPPGMAAVSPVARNHPYRYPRNILWTRKSS